ncbi:hypothetical protein EON77_08880, partial [bacterium]
MRRPLAFLAFGFATLASAQYPGATAPPKELMPGFDSIQEADARTILGYLAGPECEGRGTGQPGFQKAAEYVAARFTAAGLKPMGDAGTYFQNATFYRPAVSAVVLTTADGKTLGDSAFALSPVGKDVDVTGSIVLVRAGAQDRLSNDQLESLKGKIVVALVPAGRTNVARQLRSADAKAVLTVVDRVQPLVPRASMRRPSDVATTRLSGQISREAVGSLGSAAGAFMASTSGGVG